MSQNPLLVTLLLFALRGGDRLVEPSVHYAVDQIGQQSDAERQRAEKYGIGDSTPCRGDAGAEKECGGRSQTRHGHLQAERQRQFIDHLRKALVRIDNKTYGICRVSGKLIPKERLRAVPHATLCVEEKNNPQH